jgi:2-polyprenyl-3-methyl-5-hydroxy-6-metoxy-1,4-benzoquinol methylase
MGRQNPETFLAHSDELGIFINKQARSLYDSLRATAKLQAGSNDPFIDYFSRHHLGHRLFFSIQSSAHILYEAVKRCPKPLKEINAIDYGAGLGTLFLLGGMLGFRRFDYNDHLPEWQQTAKQVSERIGSRISGYVTGDVEAVTSFAENKGFTYDLILSRNVLEHIYSLPHFYTTLYRHNPKAVVYGTTTANYHNPLMRIYHYRIHAKAERSHYFRQRCGEIGRSDSNLRPDAISRLARQTRGLAGADFSRTLEALKADSPLPQDPTLRSNTCDCINGVWCEHLLTRNEYAAIISAAGYRMDFSAGFWDTHYPNALMNFGARLLNRCIGWLGPRKAVLISPFVNIIAY